MGHLRPLLQERNVAYLRYLRSQRHEDHRKFKEARGRAKREIRRAKNRWFESKAQEVEKGRFGGRTVWKCITDMQRERKGIQPSRIVTINDENGVLYTNPNEQHQ